MPRGRPKGSANKPRVIAMNEKPHIDTLNLLLPICVALRALLKSRGPMLQQKDYDLAEIVCAKIDDLIKHQQENK